MVAHTPTDFTNTLEVTDEVAQFSAKVEAEVDSHIAKYPADRKRSAILPILFIVQRERGWVDPAGVNYVAQKLSLQTSDVWEVGTFYSMIHMRPVGKYHIQICKTLSCKIMGEPKLTEHICNRLGIHPGETTPDGKFTVSLVECLGSCGTAPMFQIGFDYYENQTIEKVDAILDSLE